MAATATVAAERARVEEGLASVVESMVMVLMARVVAWATEAGLMEAGVGAKVEVGAAVGMGEPEVGLMVVELGAATQEEAGARGEESAMV